METSLSYKRYELSSQNCIVLCTTERTCACIYVAICLTRNFGQSSWFYHVWRVKASQRHHVTLNEWVSRGPTYNWWLVFRDRYHHRGFLSCFWEQKVTIQWRVHNDGSVLSCMAQLAQRICLKRCFAIHISPCESSINSKMVLLGLRWNLYVVLKSVVL